MEISQGYQVWNVAADVSTVERGWSSFRDWAGGPQILELNIQNIKRCAGLQTLRVTLSLLENLKKDGKVELGNLGA